jgi:hypothetical protein
MSGVNAVVLFGQLVTALTIYIPGEAARAAAARAFRAVEVDPDGREPLFASHLRQMEPFLESDIKKLAPDHYASVRTELEALGLYR